MKRILKFFTYFLGISLSIIMVYLGGLTAYDSIRINRLKSTVSQLKLGDSREKVIQLLGDPDYTWRKGSKKFTFWGKQQYYENSGIGYGKIMDWKNAFQSNFPFFYPFRFRFGPWQDDILLYLDDNGLIDKIEMPK